MSPSTSRRMVTQREPGTIRTAPAAHEVILVAADGTGREMQVGIVVGVEVHDLVPGRAQCPPRAAAGPGLREVRPGRQLRHGTQGQRHAPIMTSSPPGHQDLGMP